MIVTGGSEGGSSYLKARKVIAYNLDGWLEDLPDMINSRFGHGCGHFTNTDGVLVEGKHFAINYITLAFRCTWLLVVNITAI